MSKQEAHIRLKEQLKFEHLRDLSDDKLFNIAYEIGVIANGGAGSQGGI